MISRFFKKKDTSSPAKKAIKPEPSKGKSSPEQKILTAEGWRRMMMRSRKGKKG
ncbi:MAG TPA: hypothetical protein VGJ00_08045 [Rhabdochlamydiaceae bacterium]|jgi:hypothetical protein